MSTQAEKDAIVIDAYERLLRQIRRDQEQLSVSTRMSKLGGRFVEDERLVRNFPRRENGGIDWLHAPRWLKEDKYSDRDDREPEIERERED